MRQNLIYCLLRIFQFIGQNVNDIISIIISFLVGVAINFIFLFPKFRRDFSEKMNEIHIKAEEQLDQELTDITD